MNVPAYDAFISHASPDSHAASTLAALLSRRCRVYLQVREGLLGQEWQISIATSIRASRATIVLASASSGKALYQKAEIEFAMNYSRSQACHHLILPVFLPGYDPLSPDMPFGLNLYHGIALSSESTFEDVASLIEARLLSLQAIPQDRAVELNALPEQSTRHFLLTYSTGPMVRDLIFRHLPEAYAELIGGSQVKPIFSAVNQSLKEAALEDKSRPIRISMGELPSVAHVGGNNFWTDAFYCLAAKGPRALAAMLLAVPDDLFPDEARTERVQILAGLEKLSSKK